MAKEPRQGDLFPSEVDKQLSGKYNQRYRSRKFILTMFIALGAMLLGYFGRGLSESSLATVLVACVAAYNLTNIFDRR